MSVIKVAFAALILLVTTTESEAHAGSFKSVGDALFALLLGIFFVFVLWLMSAWKKL
jgi:hypothetical protein